MGGPGPRTRTGPWGWTVTPGSENPQGEAIPPEVRCCWGGGDGKKSEGNERGSSPTLGLTHLRYHFEDVGGVQGARSQQVESVQSLGSENLALRSCCPEAWVLSGKQQVAKENQQVRTWKGEVGGGPQRFRLSNLSPVAFR